MKPFRALVNHRLVVVRVLILFESVLFANFQLSGQTQKVLIPLDQPDLSGKLTFDNPKGSISVTGYDGNIIVVTATARFNQKDSKTQNDWKLTYDQQETNVILYCNAQGNTIDVDIKIPRHFTLQLRSRDNGDVIVIRINGAIEVDNAQGSIMLDNISGSAILNSVYGNITARFKEVNPDDPIMATTIEGDIELSLPEATHANLKLNTSRGNIISVFPLLEAGQESSPLFDWKSSKINGGGPEYILRTYNGDIQIKRYL
ncbi:MAG: DUF4097 family beta strand repeat protein [Lewinellaceae bacterium]|nr:DUF4097 family beta strand repeat protein [Saprospiraceae bacterium]MCB9269403.1 DUF4097 family beta strand repeat protein [Lewinellaceae bacterium]HPG06975.1 DUF4097 family beta strand repeat-containing protein [Saprospiraceae bacterium]HPQ98489.1 DUF4097 family beta strand repeat-containing protein [Saprospiraceae bacterium]